MYSTKLLQNLASKTSIKRKTKKASLSCFYPFISASLREIYIFREITHILKCYKAMTSQQDESFFPLLKSKGG